MSSLVVWGMVLAAAPVAGSGTYHEVTYTGSDKPGELVMGVTYTVWVPEGVKTLRGVIVHQHGCGTGACQGGATAAYDLHWQALARKWDCALLGPSYHQEEKQNCRLWCDPRNGSRSAFLRCLHDLGAKSGHPELEQVPWCLWGHSGGGFWASLMQMSDPERIVAIWFRSGTAFASWEKGEISKPTIPAAAYAIPIMANPGAKEKDDKRFRGAWDGTLAMVRAYRTHNAPAGFAPDPRTGHECGDSRYLAIPFFDTCLAARLPEPNTKNRSLRRIDMKRAWLSDLPGDHATPADQFTGDPKTAGWLPDEAFAKKWAEYIKTGAVSDTTPPPAPTNLVVTAKPDGVELTWQALADFESGLREFVIVRDGQDVGRLPAKPVGRFGRPLFQAMSYHDTPSAPMPAMKFVDPSGTAKSTYRVVAVNSVDMRSPEPAK